MTTGEMYRKLQIIIFPFYKMTNMSKWLEKSTSLFHVKKANF